MPRSAVTASGLVAVQVVSFLVLRATAEGGDPFDSPLYWWTWLLFPALAFGAASRLPDVPPVVWCAPIVVPFAAEVAWLGAVAHDSVDGASLWLAGELFVVAQGGIVLAAACGGSVEGPRTAAARPGRRQIRRSGIGAAGAGAAFGAAAFGAFEWWHQAERSVCAGIFATCMNESIGRLFWLAAGLAWLALAAGVLMRLLGVVRPALVGAIALPAHTVAAVTADVPGPSLVIAVAIGAVAWALAGLAVAADERARSSTPGVHERAASR